ncbi:MAG: ABC transporter substrate-binding protein [Armatimonadetes bacterium]|nr:ABC transporter substrate-binding protein [Armatimonadota bacterium]
MQTYSFSNIKSVARWIVPSMLALAVLPGCQPPPQQTTNAGNAPATPTAQGTPTTGGASTEGNQAPTTGDIPIGEYNGLTGETAGFGKTTHNGIVLAVEEINAAGGINGRKLKLFTLDDESKPEKVPPVVTKLITQNDVVAVLGEVASSRTIAAAPVVDRYGVPMISPSSTNTAVTVTPNGNIRDYVFRVCYIDPFQGEAMAKFLHDTKGLKRVAIFRNIKEDYSKGLADAFMKTFTEKGGTITTDKSYSTGDRDFRAQLTAIKASNPQAVFVPGYYSEVGLIARQAKEIGLNAPLAGGDGWDDPSIANLPAIQGSYITNHYSMDSKDPRSANFVAAYKKRFGQAPNALSALGYDATKLLADAMKRAKSLNGGDLRDAIAETKNFPGVTGDITINDQHNAVKPAVVLQYQNGKQVLVDTIQPAASS